MKNLLILVLFLAPALAYAQKDSLLFIHGGRNLVDDSVYKKLSMSNYTYLIPGSQALSNGFDIETTDPSISYAANYFVNRHKTVSIVGQLFGGTHDNLSDLFSGNRLSTSLKYSIGVNILCGNNSGSFDTTAEVRKRQWNFIALKIKRVLLKYDTAYVLERLVNLTVKDGSYGMFKISVDNYLLQFNTKIDTGNSIITADKINQIISGLLNRYAVNADEPEVAIYKRLMGNDYNTELENDYQNAKPILEAKHYSEALANVEIQLMKGFWHRQDTRWFNISVSGNNNSFTVFDTTNAQRIVNVSNFLPTAKISFNWLSKYKAPGEYLYWNLGAEINQVSSTDDLSMFNYATSRSLGTAQNTQINIKQTGNAYNGKALTGFGWSAFTELYYKGFGKCSGAAHTIPGIYFKMQLSYGDVWITQYRLSSYVGLIFNAKKMHRMNDRNMLTIIPYAGFADLLTDYKDPAKLTKNSLSDLFSAGVKIGIPLFAGR